MVVASGFSTITCMPFGAQASTTIICSSMEPNATTASELYGIEHFIKIVVNKRFIKAILFCITMSQLAVGS